MIRPAIITLCIALTPAAAADLPLIKPVRVIDGDTLTGTDGRSYRMVDFDAPEMFSDKCVAERWLGMAARREVARLVAAGAMIEPAPCVGRNFGRLCGRLVLNGRSVAPQLIALRLADPYSCDQAAGTCQKRREWCQP